MQTQGVIARVTQNGNRTGVKVGSQWFSTFSPFEAHQGDEVVLDYESTTKGDKTFHNIKGVKVLKKAEVQSNGHTCANGTGTSEDDRITRATALKNATQLACQTNPAPTPETVIVWASMFENYLMKGSGA